MIGSNAQNVLKFGTGGINIDASRVGGGISRKSGSGGMAHKGAPIYGRFANTEVVTFETTKGRYPANIVHDGSEEVLEAFPAKNREAARFFYCAKASTAEREEGLQDLPLRPPGAMEASRYVRGTGGAIGNGPGDVRRRNTHPTVKPIALMSWLCRLVTPPGGTVLDPFMGSGSTGIACVQNGFSFIGIEANEEYFEIAIRRIRHAIELLDIDKPAGEIAEDAAAKATGLPL